MRRQGQLAGIICCIVSMGFWGCSDMYSPPSYNDSRPNYGYADWGPNGWIIFGHTPLDSLGGFVDSSGLYLIREDGTGMRPFLLTRDVGILDNPRWSPDGQWIAFSRGFEIVKVPFSGDTIIRLTSGAGRKFFPTWSPDGSMIAFSDEERPFNERGIWIVNSNGGDSRLLKNISITTPSATEPAWSRTRNEIAFVSYRVNLGFDGLSILDTLSSQVYSIASFDRNIHSPSFSPDGSRIAFYTYPTETEEQYVWVANRDGTGLRRLTDAGGGAWPSWSPDGTKIIYTKFSSFNPIRPGNGKLWIMNADGSGKRQFAF